MKIPVPCLSCGAQLHQVMISGVEVEACLDGCGGIWFDAAELHRFNEEGEGGEDPILAKLLDLPLHEKKESGKRVCVKCGEKMKEHEFRLHSGIFIDECYSCGGIWLDGGELKAIRTNPAVKKSEQDRIEKEEEFSRKLVQDRQRSEQPSNLSKAMRVVLRSMRL